MIANRLHADLYIDKEDWYMEVIYESGDRWIVSAPNPETLSEIRDRERRMMGDLVISAVIARTAEVR